MFSIFFFFFKQKTAYELRISDWSSDVCSSDLKISDHERNLLTQIFRFFTQADIEVQDCYHDKYGRVFKPTEIKMMLTAFSNMETAHIAAYSQDRKNVV